MTTVSLNSSFLRPVLGDALITARVTKPGKTLMFGVIDIEGKDAKLCVQVTTTYALV
jgi:acyl-coenzyme A thioesterase PaaI-like protein